MSKRKYQSIVDETAAQPEWLSREASLLDHEEIGKAVEDAKLVPHDVLAILFVTMREAFILLAPVEYQTFAQTVKDVAKERGITG